jgi:hypothetical protein
MMENYAGAAQAPTLEQLLKTPQLATGQETLNEIAI